MKRFLLLVFTASVLFACKDKKADKEKTKLTKDDYSKTTTQEGKVKAGDETKGMNTTTGTSETYASTTVSNWPQSEKEGFMSSCERKAMKSGGSKELAESYCSCMMEKMEKAFPDIYKLVKLSQEELEKFTNDNREDCIGNQ